MPQTTAALPTAKPVKMTSKQVTVLRRKLRLLQRELADALGVSTRTVQGWENGRRPHGSASKMMREMEAKFDLQKGVM